MVALGLGLSIKFIDEDGKEFYIKISNWKFIWIGKILYFQWICSLCFEKEYESNAKEGIKIDSLKFVDDKMKKNFSKYTIISNKSRNILLLI